MLFWLKGHEFKPDFKCLGGWSWGSHHTELKASVPSHLQPLPPVSIRNLGGGGRFTMVTCSLHPQINHRRVSSWASPTSCLLLRKGPWWFPVHCTSVIILFVYMSVNSGSMLSVLVTLNSGALPRYGCVSWWSKCTSLLLGVFPSLLCGFSFIT